MTEELKMVKCPKCKGTGIAPESMSHAMREPIEMNGSIMDDCDLCMGIGEVLEDVAGVWRPDMELGHTTRIQPVGAVTF